MVDIGPKSCSRNSSSLDRTWGFHRSLSERYRLPTTRAAYKDGLRRASIWANCRYAKNPSTRTVYRSHCRRAIRTRPQLEREAQVKVPCVRWLLGAAVLCAQPATDSGRTYEIRGQVLDPDTGIGVPHATVTLTLSPIGAQSVQPPKPSSSFSPIRRAPSRRTTSRLASPTCLRSTLAISARISPTLASAPIVLVERKEPIASVTLYLRHAAVIRGTALYEGGASLGGNVQRLAWSWWTAAVASSSSQSPMSTWREYSASPA